MTRSATYVSYAQEDAPFAGAVCDALKRAGTRVASTPYGAPDDASDSAKNAIAQCRVLIGLYSRHANVSSYVMREVEYASQHEIPILPVRLEDVPMSEELEFYLSTYHWLDDGGISQDRATQEVAKRVERLANQPDSSTALKRQAAPARPRRTGPEFARWWNRGRHEFERRTRHWSPAARRAVVAAVVVAAMFIAGSGIRAVFARPTGTQATYMGSGPNEPFDFRNLPQDRVRIWRGFWLSKYEVTQAQWMAVMSPHAQRPAGEAELPVRGLSWARCREFIAELNGSDDGPFRLPTEAEWEYACRAGSDGPYCSGTNESSEELSEYAWFRSNADSLNPVGRKKPNAWGFHDMHGNIREIVFDWSAGEFLEHFKDPPKTREALNRTSVIARGGHYGDSADDCRSGSREKELGDKKNRYNGFRLCAKKLPS